MRFLAQSFKTLVLSRETGLRGVSFVIHNKLLSTIFEFMLIR